MIRNDDESRVWRELDDSMLGRGFAAVVGRVSSAAPGSLLLRSGRDAAASVRAQSPADRLRAIATFLLTAVAAHVALQLVERPVGWWWLIVPGMVTAFAVALLVSATVSRGGPR